jgi:hypothetical protein
MKIKINKKIIKLLQKILDLFKNLIEIKNY